MSRALDPYHRIRALVAAIFLLTVATMAVATMHGPHHRGLGGALVTGAVPAATPAVGGLVTSSGTTASAPSAGVGAAAGSRRPHARSARTRPGG